MILLPLKFVVSLFLATVLVASAAAQDLQIIPKRWQSSHYANHSLVGRIFNGSGDEITINVVARELSGIRFVLLGEQHDNPDHHVIQANFVRQLALGNNNPSVVFEMVPHRLANEISQYDLGADPLLDDFAKRLEWEKRGWYTWKIYRPIALAAAQNGLSMVAGNLDRATTRAISRNGLDHLTDDQRLRYGLDEDLPEKETENLLAELGNSHCGLMPKTALPSMANVQRAIDGALTDAIINSAASTEGKTSAILIAGNGHIRNDRAVPFVLKKKRPETSVATLGLIEVDPDHPSFQDYGLSGATGKQLYDYVIFTPKFDITDHCVELRKRFSKPAPKKP